MGGLFLLPFLRERFPVACNRSSWRGSITCFKAHSQAIVVVIMFMMIGLVSCVNRICVRATRNRIFKRVRRKDGDQWQRQLLRLHVRLRQRQRLYLTVLICLVVSYLSASHGSPSNVYHAELRYLAVFISQSEPSIALLTPETWERGPD